MLSNGIETLIKARHKSIDKRDLLRADISSIKLHRVEKDHSRHTKMKTKMKKVIPKFDLRRRSYDEQ